MMVAAVAVLASPVIALDAAAAPPPVWVVNSAADPGSGGCDQVECTLREALTAANANGEDADVIRFAIPGDLPVTIRPASPLPDIRPGSSSTASPSPATRAPRWWSWTAPSPGRLGAGVRRTRRDWALYTIRGLVINRFARNGILDLQRRL